MAIYKTLEDLERMGYAELRNILDLDEGYPTRLEMLKAICTASKGISPGSARDHYWRCALAYLGSREYIETYGLRLTYSEVLSGLERLRDIAAQDTATGACPLGPEHFELLQAIGWQQTLEFTDSPVYWQYFRDMVLPHAIERVGSYWEKVPDAIACGPGQQDLYVQWMTQYAN